MDQQGALTSATSHSTGSTVKSKVVSSPVSILVKVPDGNVTYLEFLEDSYGTAASFRTHDSWTVQTEPGAEPFQV
jgi:uncharacterized protein